MTNIDEKLFGRGLLTPKTPSSAGLLADRFIVPPFSVLNARDGNWQSRKAAWLKLGIEGEVGRSVNPGGGAMPACDYSGKARGDGRGRALPPGRAANLTIHAKDEEGYADSTRRIASSGSTTSIFDPVLCELCYRWFCPLGGQVVDPFAGGSVRGIVAHILGRRYWGGELRPEQVVANVEQANRILPDNQPVWITGDSRVTLRDAPESDFIFSCPPYGDLEKYSSEPDDLSAMSLSDFKQAYFEIIAKSVAKMKDDSFACFVVGDYRDKEGNYNNFPGGTIAAFKRAGANLYNEMVLVTAVGSLSLRTSSFFEKSRKAGKAHQNVLVFVKGDGRRAADKINSSEV